MTHHHVATHTPTSSRAVRRALVMLAASLTLVTPALDVLAAPPSAADPTIASDQAQASQLTSEINLENGKLNSLDEQYNEAQIQVQKDDQEVATAQSKLAQAKGAEQQTVAALRRQAVNAYIQGGTVASLAALVDGNGNDMAVRSYYLDQASNQAQETAAQLRNQQHEISKEQAVYSQALAQDTANKNQVAADQAAAQNAIATEHQQLASVNNQIRQLIQQQQQQQAEAAAQAAAAAAAASSAASSQSSQGADPPVGPAPPPNTRAGIAVQAALAQIGKPYIWGGSGPDGFDCSGLTMYAWGQAGVGLSHGSIAQYYETTRISASELEPGDLVFYSPPGDPPLGHVAMYIGAGEVVEANTEGTPVGEFSMYYVGPPVGFGRVS